MNSTRTSALMLSFLVISFLGFADSLYLSVTHYLNATPSCFIAKGCDIVTTSTYSEIFGFPVAFLGVTYYLLLIVLAIIYLDKKKNKVFKLLPWVTTLGVTTSLWLLYVQVFILKSLCSYCIISAFISITLFVIAVVILKFYSKTT
ncbi:MAG: hypothetical protein COV95_00990 [Candidatus Zambryskibacteria bacterium CG11_big_fil_rev_8_21_14_0_20_40_24]|uniref:Vitamin K epoxide reductase domain-containing protein n=1 Tax=Candidatus Zambryskibacteria bacterium CG11_big_fil_rev_8_21_14_0_20_40_24 TaxID=1975116 RepID=A0A2H0K6Z6_9BACT|nr:MAG: hypothetical protein COV95_00990 [Candidatus Zambryskibacteria bacterium CG11_big_fil_rev_8_21_14_0_20_40_24]